MKLNINTPSRHWEEAAIIARAQASQNLINDGKDNAVQIIGKFKYNIWKTKTAVNIELVE